MFKFRSGQPFAQRLARVAVHSALGARANRERKLDQSARAQIKRSRIGHRRAA